MRQLRTLEIAAHAAYDNWRRPLARRSDDVPYAPEAITREWLTAVLCAADADARVLDVIPRGGSVGTCTRQAFELVLNDEAVALGVPARLFVKSTPALAQRLLLGLSKVIWGEVGFYRSFRRSVDIEAPMGYFAAAAPRSLRSIVVVEDVVATKGARFNGDGDAISRSEMADLLAGLAALHGRYWAASEVRREHPWLRDTRTYLRDNDRLIDMQRWAAVGTEAAGELVPKSLQGHMGDIWRGVVACNAEAAKRPATILHGDAHIAQTYQTREGRMGLSDWQVLLHGEWAWDVSYIMSTGLEIEDRRAWEKDLLGHYLDRLAAAGGPAMSFDEAWRPYRQNVLYAYTAWAFTMGYNRSVRVVQPELTTSRLVRRTAQAIEDLESISAATA
jgi:hypothetical protein